MNISFKLLQTLFVRNTKMLLFINNKQRKVFKLYVLCKQCMGADNNINLPVGKFFPCRTGFLCTHQSGKTTNTHRQSLKPFNKTLVVLSRKQCRRNDNRNLPPFHRSDEGRPECDLSFAEANVTTHQSVHRAAQSQIIDDGFNRLKLVFRFFKRKTCTEFIICTILRQNFRGRLQLPRSCNLDKLIRHLANTFFELGFTGLPSRSAQPVHLDQHVIGTVSGQKFDIFHGKKQLVATMIDKLQTIMRRAHDINGLQTVKAANPVIDMNNIIARAKARSFRQEIVCTLLPVAANQPVSQHILFGNYRQIFRLKTCFQTQHQQMDICRI